MPKNEEGEFELVVGNRQLLTVVFIMMVLFGVVFTMGYLVGRTASPGEGPPVMAAAKGQPADAAAQRPGPSQPLPAPESTAAPELPPQGETKTPVGTVPVGGAPTAVTEPPAPPVETAQKPTGPLPPAPGQTFLQVGAVKRPEAEVIVDVLKKRGFSARVAPVVAGQPEDALWRVLVGPVPDAAALAKTRADLQNAGFPVIVRKY